MQMQLAPIGERLLLMLNDEHGAVAPDNNIAELVPTKPDAEVAADLRRRFEEAMQAPCAIMDEAVSRGLQIQWDNVAYFGPPVLRHRVNGLRVVKVFSS